jgi:hypothetical protein
VKSSARCVLFALALGLASCGGHAINFSTQIVTGDWLFTFVSSKGGKTVTGQGPLSQTGVNITGTLTLTGSACSSSAEAAGTVTNDSLNMILTENGQAMTLVGETNFFITTASGTYTTDPGGCLNGDTGTWTASKAAPAGEETKREGHPE